MSISSGYFDSINSDRTYDARDMSMYFKGLISDGIYENVGDKLQVLAASGMTVNVGTGRAIIDCQWLENDGTETLTIDAAEIEKNRIDAIALRLDMTETGRSITLIVKKGTSVTGQAAAPERTWTENIKELYLATITIYSTTTALTQANITDTRYTNLCGIVTGLIDQVDTSNLFTQYQVACESYMGYMQAELNTFYQNKQAEFEEWFNTLTDTLNVSTTLVKYENTVNATTTTGYISLINMGIPQYSSGDIVLVFIGGVLMISGEEYTITGTGSNASIYFTESLKYNNRPIPITIVVIKSVIGGNVIS